MSEKTYSAEAVHRMLDALVLVIADKCDEIDVLKSRPVDHSCEVVDRQVSALLEYVAGRRAIEARTVERFLLTDPADDKKEAW
jgi:hypothetical protein